MGENTGGGYGIAGRANGGHGAVFGENTAGGPALELHTTGGAAPMTVDSTAEVANLNADQLDGLDASAFMEGNGTYVTKRMTQDAPASGTTQGTLLDIPGFGTLVATCYSDARSVIQYQNGDRAVDFWNTAGDFKGAVQANESPFFVDNSADPPAGTTTLALGHGPTVIGAEGTARFSISTYADTSRCHYQLDGIETFGVSLTSRTH